MKKYLMVLSLITSNCIALVDITIRPTYDYLMLRSLDATIASRPGQGFFCALGIVTNNLIYYEQDGIKSVHIDWTNQFFPYKDGPNENGWDLYFEPITIDPDSINPDEHVYQVDTSFNHELHDQICVAQWLRYDDYLPYRQFVHEKINKYIHIKPHILDKVELFYQQHMQDHLCIGVHVRYATAHQGEAPGGHPPLMAYCKEIDTLLNAHKDRNIKIFLATDSHTVINYFKGRYGTLLVYIDTHRSKDKEDHNPIYGNREYWLNHPAQWHKIKAGYKGGLGALMDCLLLSKCEYLIHITSNLPTYVCFFNPHIKSIYLPRGVTFKHCRYRHNPIIRNKFLNPI